MRIGKGGILVIKRPWPSMIRTIWGDPGALQEELLPRGASAASYYLAGDGAVARQRHGYFTHHGPHRRRAERVGPSAGHDGDRVGAGRQSAGRGSRGRRPAGRHDRRGRVRVRRAEAGAAVAATRREKIAKELRDWVGKEIGPIAKPKDIRFGDNLPKTRSGKIMRRLLRSIAKGEEITQDMSTLENPAILDQLKQALCDGADAAATTCGCRRMPTMQLILPGASSKLVARDRAARARGSGRAVRSCAGAGQDPEANFFYRIAQDGRRSPFTWLFRLHHAAVHRRPPRAARGVLRPARSLLRLATLFAIANACIRHGLPWPSACSDADACAHRALVLASELAALVRRVQARDTRAQALRAHRSRVASRRCAARSPRIGFALAQEDRKREALAKFDRCDRRLAPDDAESHFNRGFLLQELNDHEAAIAALRARARAQSGHDRALYGWRCRSSRCGGSTRRVAPLKQNTKLQPMSPYGWYQLGASQFERGKTDKTQAIIDHLAKFEPKVARAAGARDRPRGAAEAMSVADALQRADTPASRRTNEAARIGHPVYTARQLAVATRCLYSLQISADRQAGRAGREAPPEKVRAPARSQAEARGFPAVREEEPAMQLTEKHLEYWSKNLRITGDPAFHLVRGDVRHRLLRPRARRSISSAGRSRSTWPRRAR